MTTLARPHVWSKPTSLPPRPRRPFGEGLGRQLKALAERKIPAPPSPQAPAPAPAKVSAIGWYMSILGKYAGVADPEQLDFARYLACDDNLSGVTIEHRGPTYEELDARLRLLAGLVPPEPPAEPKWAPGDDAPLWFVMQLREAWHGVHGVWISVEEARGVIANLRRLGLDARGVPLG